MKNVELAVNAMRDANPVPDADAFAQFVVESSVFLDATRERSTKMQTELNSVETQHTHTTVRRRLKPALALVALLVVAVVAAAVVLATRSEPEVADDPQSIAERVIAGDGAVARELLTADALVDAGAATDTSSFVAHRDWLEAIGWVSTVTECTEAEADIGVTITCFYDYQNAWAEALGEGPYSGSAYAMVIVDGKIQQLKRTGSLNIFNREAWLPMVAWIRQNHPEDIGRMLSTSDGNNITRLTPESIALWEQYTNEFVASVADGAE